MIQEEDTCHMRRRIHAYYEEETIRSTTPVNDSQMSVP
jgi:hypothetical protein